MVGGHRDISLTMRSLPYTRALLIALSLMGTAYALCQNPVYELAAKQQTAMVTIMALSASVHAGTANSEEVYLADVELNGRSHQLAKLVDTYSSSGIPIRRAILTERHLLRMRLLRNADCDATGQSFFIGTDDANVFDAATRDALKNNAAVTIPCFNVIHDATRLAK